MLHLVLRDKKVFFRGLSITLSFIDVYSSSLLSLNSVRDKKEESYESFSFSKTLLLSSGDKFLGLDIFGGEFGFDYNFFAALAYAAKAYRSSYSLAMSRIDLILLLSIEYVPGLKSGEGASLYLCFPPPKVGSASGEALYLAFLNFMLLPAFWAKNLFLIMLWISLLILGGLLGGMLLILIPS